MAAVSYLSKVCAIAQLGMARGAVATVIEGAVRAIGSVAKQSQSTDTLAGALRNWVRFDTLFFYPNSVGMWYSGKDFKNHQVGALSYGLDASRELAQWTLRHMQIPTKNTPVEGVFNLAERAACLGLLVSSVFDIDAKVTQLETQGTPDAYVGEEAAYKKSMCLQIAMKGCVVADATLRLIARDFAWYKTADTCVRVTAAVCLLLYLWIDPKSPAYTAGILGQGPGGGDDGKAKAKDV